MSVFDTWAANHPLFAGLRNLTAGAGNGHFGGGGFGGHHMMQPPPVMPPNAEMGQPQQPTLQNFTLGNRLLGLPLNYGS